MSRYQSERTINDVIRLYQHKIKKNNNRAYIKCREGISVGPDGRITNLNYYAFNHYRGNVGTKVISGRFGKSRIIKVGSFQLKTDTFEIENSDSLIVFHNPFLPRVIHGEADSIDKYKRKPTTFYAGWYAGYSHAFLLNGALLFECRKKVDQSIEILVYDSVSRQPTILQGDFKLPAEPCFEHNNFPN